MKKIILILTFVFLGQSAFGQATRVFDFLYNDPSARSSSMAGTTLTLPDDPAMMQTNPSLINTIQSQQISFTFFKHLLDINSGSVYYANNFSGIGNVAAGLNFVSYGSFNKTDKNGNVQGEFGASDLVFSVGYATNLGEDISAGLTGKFVYSGIDAYSSSALALDGGLFYNDTNKRLQLGLSILNLGTQITKFDNKSEDLPLDLKFGVSHQLKGLPLFIALNFSRLLDNTDDFFSRFANFSIGGEFKISNPIRLRFGYNNKVRGDIAFGETKELAGFSGGFGFLFQDYRFDYGFSSLSRLGSLHRVTVNVKL